MMAEIPTVLTDRIRKGNGIIDLFKDVIGSELQQHLQEGTLYLGVDLNENASGNESSTSSGIAIKEMEIIIKTNNGDISFSEFHTNTTAVIQEEGSAQAQEYHTLFGSSGSSSITGSTSNFDISAFDDIIVFENVNILNEDEVIGAELRVTFLTTSGIGENETFFDYSGGFEEFAILTSSDAKTIESTNKGITDSPIAVTYNVDAPSGTPEPYWFLLLIIPVIILWRKIRYGTPDT